MPCPSAVYPASFATDLQAYLDHLAGNDLFAETARQPACPLTIHDNRLQLLQLAAALVRSGWDPTSIGRLADLIAVDAARGGAEVHLATQRQAQDRPAASVRAAAGQAGKTLGEGIA